MEKKMSIDATQIAMMVTDNEFLYYNERNLKEGRFFNNDNYKVPPTSVRKEVDIALISKGTYPSKYIEYFIDLAKKTNCEYITFEMGKGQAPIKVSFISEDKMQLAENGKPTEAKTHFWLAPRIDDDYPKDKTEKTIRPWDEEVDAILEENIRLKEQIEKHLERINTYEKERSAVLEAAAKQREGKN